MADLMDMLVRKINMFNHWMRLAMTSNWSAIGALARAAEMGELFMHLGMLRSQKYTKIVLFYWLLMNKDVPEAILAQFPSHARWKVQEAQRKYPKSMFYRQMMQFDASNATIIYNPSQQGKKKSTPKHQSQCSRSSGRKRRSTLRKRKKLSEYI